MNKIDRKREDEKDIIHKMIKIYCRGHKHETCENTLLCSECDELYKYACQRVDKCPFMETKTFCSACKVHCYKKDMKAKVKDVMKYSGPRMIFVHPWLAIKHCIITLKMKLNRRR